jgi:hypothetical protein
MRTRGRKVVSNTRRALLVISTLIFCLAFFSPAPAALCGSAPDSTGKIEPALRDTAARARQRNCRRRRGRQLRQEGTWSTAFIDPTSVTISDEKILIYGELGGPSGIRLASSDSMYYPVR